MPDVLPLVVGTVATIWLNTGCAGASHARSGSARGRQSHAAAACALASDVVPRRSVSVPQRLLRGLQAYHLAPGDADAPPPEASKKDKKARPVATLAGRSARLTLAPNAGWHQPRRGGACAEPGGGAPCCASAARRAARASRQAAIG